MFGGLANKLFQYSFYKGLINKGYDAYIDNYSWQPKWNFENIELQNVFPNLKMRFATKRDIILRCGGRNIINKIRRNIKILIPKQYFRQNTLKYIDEIYRDNNLNYFDGLWQSEKYFIDIRDEIKKDFQFEPLNELDKKNFNLLNELINVNSVAIHIRKGKDYQRNDVNGTCDANYYKAAIEYIKNNTKKPKFYIFSDNFNWVEKYLKDYDFNLINWNLPYGPKSYIDMQLMSVCKHNIIANSTYSWWGAWLNNNPEKIVIGPRKWFSDNGPKYDINDLYPPSWIIL